MMVTDNGELKYCVAIIIITIKLNTCWHDYITIIVVNYLHCLVYYLFCLVGGMMFPTFTR